MNQPYMAPSVRLQVSSNLHGPATVIDYNRNPAERDLWQFFPSNWPNAEVRWGTLDEIAALGGTVLVPGAVVTVAQARGMCPTCHGCGFVRVVASGIPRIGQSCELPCPHCRGTQYLWAASAWLVRSRVLGESQIAVWVAGLAPAAGKEESRASVRSDYAYVLCGASIECGLRQLRHAALQRGERVPLDGLVEQSTLARWLGKAAPATERSAASAATRDDLMNRAEDMRRMRGVSYLAQYLAPGWIFGVTWTGAPNEETPVLLLLHSTGLWCVLDKDTINAINEDNARGLVVQLQSALDSGCTGPFKAATRAPGPVRGPNKPRGL